MDNCRVRQTPMELRQTPGRRGRRIHWLRLVFGIAAVVGLLWLVVVLAPGWFVDDDSLEGLKAPNEVRTTSSRALLERSCCGERTSHGVNFTLHEGTITERYTRAIEQLGHEKLDVRLGGIYALERIARNPLPDRITVGKVLTAYLRTHSPWPPVPPQQPTRCT